MKELEKRIAEIKQDLSYLHFAEHLSKDGEERMAQLEKELEELEKERTGGWVVEMTYKDTKHFGTGIIYLTDDSNLCFCEDPTYFETEDEAKVYLEKAKLNKEEFNVRICHYENSKN